MKITKYTKNVIITILIIITWTQFNLKKWSRESVIVTDAIHYYGYLPVIFIYNDVKMDSIAHKSKFNYRLWAVETPTGSGVFKTSMGMSYLFSPFFFSANLYQKITGGEVDGYSVPYHFAISIACIVYLLFGLIFLAKSLSKFFNDLIVGISMLILVFGTNLFYYASIEAAMSHAYNFSLFSLFIFLTIKFYEQPKWKYIISLGLTLGLITLIRPTNIIISLVFVFYNINSFDDLYSRIHLYKKHILKILLLIPLLIILWIPQFIYWKITTGTMFYYPYREEGFFFDNPHIINGLFSFRKGWLLYTPLMSLALTGIFFMKAELKKLRPVIVLFLLINTYVVLSWWCWWYGGSFGLRAFIESYSLLAFPLAAFISWIFSKKIFVKIISSIVILLFIGLNLFQTLQYKHGIIHWDSMSKEAYREVFLIDDKPENYDDLIDKPDYDKALKGEDE